MTDLYQVSSRWYGFSITSDNGRNMVKAIELLNIDATVDLEEDDDKDEEFMKLVENVNFPNVQLVRCAAHTLQLCVYDVNKQSDISQKVSACRQMYKILRTGKYRRTLTKNNKQISTLDVTTRWNSTYMMLSKLFAIKEFVEKEFSIDNNIDWGWVELYIEPFRDTYEETLKLQMEQLTYIDFFILWMKLKLKCKKSKNVLSQKLLVQLKIRESKLLQNEAFLSAIYMDPRINKILSDRQMLAKQNLKKIALRIFNLNQLNDTLITGEEPKSLKEVCSTDAVEETSLFSSYLDEMETLPQAQEEAESDKMSKIYMDIENFNLVFGRLPLNSDIKQFYHDLRFKSPLMSELAQVVLATPATQVSVERAYLK